MPIIKGTTNIGAIYKGTTPISAIYKGSTLVYSSFSWENYGYTYLYNSLIPTTINSKNVLDKSKISKIYANGVIENQLIQNGNFVDSSEWSVINATFSVSNNVATVVATGSDFRFRQASIPIVSGNKYMFITTIKVVAFGGNGKIELFDNDGRFSRTVLINSPVVGQTYKCAVFFTATGTGNSMLMIRNVYSGDSGDTFDISNTMLINLSIREGVGNEPTTLTDNRIQKLLNRGYIDYNAGSYKGTDISEFSSEPYNIWDEQWEVGGISANGSNNSGTTTIRSTNYINVFSGRTYTFEVPTDYLYCFEYDEQTTFIKRTQLILNNGSANITLTNETNYIRFYVSSSYGTTYSNNICFHETGTRTGYAPHTQPQTLSLRYQGNGALSAHDTYEITATSHIFTKNVGSIDMGSLNWRLGGSGFFYDTISNMKSGTINTVPNVLCPKYITSSKNNNTPNSVSNEGTNILIKDSSYTDATTFKTAMNGVMLYYELATPQVITIPRKHLGIVDLGSLNWSYETITSWSIGGRFVINLSSLGIKPNSSVEAIPNIYQYIYNLVATNQAGGTNDKIIYQYQSVIYIHNSKYNTSTLTDFKNSLSGVYLFYETNEDVADITNVINIEAGGTITSNSVVLPNVNTLIKCK